jgi:hypothetical protein
MGADIVMESMSRVTKMMSVKAMFRQLTRLYTGGGSDNCRGSARWLRRTRTLRHNQQTRRLKMCSLGHPPLLEQLRVY